MISVAFGALVFGSHYSPVSRVFLLETVGLRGFHPSSPSGKGHSKGWRSAGALRAQGGLASTGQLWTGRESRVNLSPLLLEIALNSDPRGLPVANGEVIKSPD